MNRRCRYGECGFTLIEVLAAMSVGIVLVYLLSETLTLTQNGWARAVTSSESTRQENRADLTLRPLLEHMLPPTPDGREDAVTARSDSLEFFTLPPQARTAHGVMRGRLAIESDGDGLFALVLDLAPAVHELPIPERRRQRVLVSGLAAARISYFYAGPMALSESPAWPGELPELIVVSWSRPGVHSDTGELAVRPRVSLSGRCHLDLASGTCRES